MVLKYTSADGHTILVGQSAYENEQLVAQASPQDLWFHLEQLPSCHVILQQRKA
eukprot:SAG31_NODE_46888_length_252_cov_1.013072_1_plen_53_part_01